MARSGSCVGVDVGTHKNTKEKFLQEPRRSSQPELRLWSSCSPTREHFGSPFLLCLAARGVQHLNRCRWPKTGLARNRPQKSWGLARAECRAGLRLASPLLCSSARGGQHSGQLRALATSKEERDSFLALARAEEEAEEAEAERAAEQMKKVRRPPKLNAKEWDGEGVSRKIVEKLRKEGRGGDDTDRYERMARAQEYKLKRQMDKQQQDERDRVARIERQLQAERERREAEEKQKEEDKKKGTAVGFDCHLGVPHLVFLRLPLDSLLLLLAHAQQNPPSSSSRPQSPCSSGPKKQPFHPRTFGELEHLNTANRIIDIHTPFLHNDGVARRYGSNH